MLLFNLYGNISSNDFLHFISYMSRDRFYVGFFVCLFVLCVFFGATTAAYGSSQARGLIGATVASLHHSYSSARSKPHLRPTPELMAMLDP